jgi:predicted transcriptional regulator
MSSEKLKEYLHQIADNVNSETRLDDIYEQLALLDDIDQSEEQEKLGKVVVHEEVVSRSKEWLK